MIKELHSETKEILNLKEDQLYGAVKNVFNIDFVSGLPCGELRNFITESQRDSEVMHIQATNERESVAIAVGSWMAGKKPVLYMQNSGLFEASNDLGSLMIPCKIPTLFVVSWRGAPGESATQHLYTGAATIPFLESMKVPYVVEPNAASLEYLRDKMEESSFPGIILKKRERFNKPCIEKKKKFLPVERKVNNIALENIMETELSREKVLDILFTNLITEKDAVFSSTGLISRSIYHHYDAGNQFYNAGAFGLTSTIGLGFSVNREFIRTLAIEGDGSVLTNLGALNVIGKYGKDNFLHIILDNGAYVSCSGEDTYGAEAIPDLASIFGYQNIYSVGSETGIKNSIRELNTVQNGPNLLHIKINRQGERSFKRPLEMSEIARRLRNYFITYE